MTQTLLCAEGNHTHCRGACAKWSANRDDVVIDAGPLIESDGVGVLVQCMCSCHSKGGDQEN